MTAFNPEELRKARLEAGWSIADAARQLKRRSAQPLPTLDSLVRTWKRWEAGSSPSRTYQPLLFDLFEHPDGDEPTFVTRPVPTVWRRWLALELRRLREDAGLSREEAAQACGWPAARIAYMEDVQHTLMDEDLEKLLPVYEVPTQRWNVYFDAALERAGSKGWWERSDERDLPEWASLRFGLERGANRVRTYEVLAVPGLLQTFDYAVEILGTDLIPKTRSQLRSEAQSRLDRQWVLTRSPEPLELTVVVEHSALTRIPGTPAVMAEQLTHLAEMAERPNITVQVLPADLLHSYTFGTFSILGFPWAADPGAVYVEHRDGALFLEEPHEVAAHALVFQHLCTLALEPDESIVAIKDLAEKMHHDRTPEPLR